MGSFYPGDDLLGGSGEMIYSSGFEGSMDNSAAVTVDAPGSLSYSSAVFHGGSQSLDGLDGDVFYHFGSPPQGITISFWMHENTSGEEMESFDFTLEADSGDEDFDFENDGDYGKPWVRYGGSSASVPNYQEGGWNHFVISLTVTGKGRVCVNNEMAMSHTLGLMKVQALRFKAFGDFYLDDLKIFNYGMSVEELTALE